MPHESAKYDEILRKLQTIVHATRINGAAVMRLLTSEKEVACDIDYMENVLLTNKINLNGDVATILSIPEIKTVYLQSDTANISYSLVCLDTHVALTKVTNIFGKNFYEREIIDDIKVLTDIHNTFVTICREYIAIKEHYANEEK